ncbi:hypothetical protein TNCV_3228701 [Trichonephila clavipes]|nr:hypothetical protein TNCV_3228701 [Trichonephila clavipes]
MMKASRKRSDYDFILETGIWTDSSIPYLDLKVLCDVFLVWVDGEAWPLREEPMANRRASAVKKDKSYWFVNFWTLERNCLIGIERKSFNLGNKKH